MICPCVVALMIVMCVYGSVTDECSCIRVFPFINIILNKGYI